MRIPLKNIDKDRVRFPLDFNGHKFPVPTLEQSRAAIQNIDFSMLVYKICTPSPVQAIVWEPDVAVEAVKVYKKWLWIIRKYSEEYPVLPPSIEIDEIWHHHILDTLKYAEDCQAVFGQFMHHYPYFGMRGEQDYSNLNASFELTKLLYEEEFGEELPSFLAVEIDA